MQRLATYQKKNELVRRLSARSLPRRRKRVDVAVGFLALLLPCRDRPGLRRDKPGLRRDKPGLCRAGRTPTPAKPLLCQLL